MQRWNGWGDDTIHIDLPPKAGSLLRALAGAGMPMGNCPLDKLLASVPATRLPGHPLISLGEKERLDHAHGQSLPDWIALRWGTLQHFPDGVAIPSTSEQVRELLKFAD